MRHFAAIVANQSFAKIICATRVEMSWIVLALQNIYVSEATHSLVGLPSRSSQQACSRVGCPPSPRLRRDSFALHYVASEGWRRGELNPLERTQTSLSDFVHEGKLFFLVSRIGLFQRNLSQIVTRVLGRGPYSAPAVCASTPLMRHFSGDLRKATVL